MLAFAFLQCGMAVAQVEQAPAARGSAETAAAAGAPEELESIVVTGSLLRGGFTTPTPVTVVSGPELLERAPGNIYDSLSDLPSFVNDSTATSGARGAGGVGESNVDLRGLGDLRTLVLVDGRRVVGFGGNGLVDTNIIPVSLVERVDVVTGGASAAYGSDAVAGVVNFILKDRIDGIQADYHYGESKYGDNIENSINIAAGKTFFDNKLSVVFGADYNRNEGTGSLYSRPWGQLEPGVIGLPGTRAAGLPATLLTTNVEFANQTPGSIITTGPLKGTVYGPGGVPGVFQYGNLIGGSVMTGSTANYGSSVQDHQPLEIPVERATAMMRLTYELNKDVTLYSELGIAQTNAHSHTFTYSSSSIISIDNPYLPAATKAAMTADGLTAITIGRENDEYRGIRSDPQETLARSVVGANGKLIGDWKWDLSWTHGETHYNYRPYGEPLTANYNAAIDAVVDPLTGGIVCAPIATNPNLSPAQRKVVQPGCQPFNPFGVGSPSTAALNYTAFNYLDWADEVRVEDSAAFTVTGEPFKLPAGAVQIATGATFRSDSYNQTSSLQSQEKLFFVGNQPTYSGKEHVTEVFVETEVPLLTDMFLAKSLAFNAAGRFTDYSVSGSVKTWKMGLTYNPNDWLLVRTTLSQDIRAPGLMDLFSPAAGGSCPACIGINNNVGFVTTTVLGNPELKPEDAKTYTGGLVFTPPGTGFRASIDYYDIRLSGVIATPLAQDVINRCLIQHLQQFCSYITFTANPPAGSVGISNVNLPNLNLNELEARGIDLAVSYQAPINSVGIPGALNLRILGNWADELTTTTAVAGKPNLAINNAGITIPHFRGTYDMQYGLGSFNVGTTFRFQSAMRYSPTLVGPDQGGYNPALANSVNDNRFGGTTYIDLNGSYDLPPPFGFRFAQVYASVINLTNKAPPIGYTFQNSGASDGQYDMVGQTFKIGVRVKY